MYNDNDFFELAAAEARKGTCLQARCGSIIVDAAGEVLGRGFNAPALGLEDQRQCGREWAFKSKKKADRTCCVHAEWNTIIDALNSQGNLVGRETTLYFMRVDERGIWTDAGEPYCTVCSRLSLQAGIKNFALWVDGEARIYDTRNYNTASYGSSLL